MSGQMKLKYLNIHVATFKKEPSQSSLLFEQRRYVSQADFGREALQVGKESVGAQCGNVLARVQ